MPLSEEERTSSNGDTYIEGATLGNGVLEFIDEDYLALYKSNENIQIVTDMFKFIFKCAPSNYFIRRVDIAFDYLMPYSKSIFMNTNLNQKREVFESTYSIGSSKNSKRKELSSHYDRSFKVRDTVYSNRAEVEYFFNKDDSMQFYEFHHSEINKRLNNCFLKGINQKKL
ncbi:hypothetical protein [Lysinibacillus sp. GbtcB16]|uniref:hypothetical protein n=1 Tax=Lysinibacillus sp. GbtcB16 TaxID=2824761 RepID=UPI001C2F1BF9|nr:hypothetical protein [Lysinibacillus sp. GbtcB16]